MTGLGSPVEMLVTGRDEQKNGGRICWVWGYCTEWELVRYALGMVAGKEDFLRARMLVCYKSFLPKEL